MQQIVALPDHEGSVMAWGGNVPCTWYAGTLLTGFCCFDQDSDVRLLEMVTAPKHFGQFQKTLSRKDQNTCASVGFSRKLYWLMKVQQLIKFLTFRSLHFHLPDPTFDFSRVWYQDYVSPTRHGYCSQVPHVNSYCRLCSQPPLLNNRVRQSLLANIGGSNKSTV